MFQSVISLIPLTLRIVFAVAFILSFDLYAYQSVRKLSSVLQLRYKRLIRYSFWGLSIVLYTSALLAMGGYLVYTSRTLYVIMTGTFFATFLAKILMIIPLLMEDLYRAGRWIYDKTRGLVRNPGKDAPESGNGRTLISRKTFISRLSVGIGGFTVSGLGYGVVKGAHDYKIHRSDIPLQNLPNSFKGMRIGHLSDIHSGSFWDKEAVKKGVQLMLDEKPDVIFFTGDLVNSLADEMNDDYIEIFSRLKAPMGVYSILGNHDYGDYHQWPDRNTEMQGNNMQADKSHMTPMQLENLEKLKNVHKQMGWDLLLNEHRVLQKGDDKIALIGVENYGARGRFARYGVLSKAWEGTAEYPVRLLLSHDPSHWESQVTKKYTDIDITFSGHTHGAQFGVETAGFRWSPIQLMYKQWAGLYRQGSQFLYVNRGFGYLGHPGRLGIRPEIGIITLV